MALPLLSNEEPCVFQLASGASLFRDWSLHIIIWRVKDMNLDIEGCVGEKSFSVQSKAEEDRRRTIRIKRAGLDKCKLGRLDRPAIKFAESKEELEQSFALVYHIYRKKGFVPEFKPHNMLYSIYSLLPWTTHIIAKSYKDVISNLTEIFDTPEFGLPMDAVYKPELDAIRSKGRMIVELSALATPTEHRWKNIFLYLVQVMYWYSLVNGVDDVCVTVNPRHKRFYMQLFPFEQIGPERYYPRVNAPAVGLRGKVREAYDRMRDICDDLEFETPLYTCFRKMTGEQPQSSLQKINLNSLQILVQPNKLESTTVNHFLRLDPTLTCNLTLEQKGCLSNAYPDIVYLA